MCLKIYCIMLIIFTKATLVRGWKYELIHTDKELTCNTRSPVIYHKNMTVRLEKNDINENEVYITDGFKMLIWYYKIFTYLGEKGCCCSTEAKTHEEIKIYGNLDFELDMCSTVCEKSSVFGGQYPSCSCGTNDDKSDEEEEYTCDEGTPVDTGKTQQGYQRGYIEYDLDKNNFMLEFGNSWEMNIKYTLCYSKNTDEMTTWPVETSASSESSVTKIVNRPTITQKRSKASGKSKMKTKANRKITETSVLTKPATATARITTATATGTKGKSSSDNTDSLLVAVYIVIPVMAILIIILILIIIIKTRKRNKPKIRSNPESVNDLKPHLAKQRLQVNNRAYGQISCDAGHTRDSQYATINDYVLEDRTQGMNYATGDTSKLPGNVYDKVPADEGVNNKLHEKTTHVFRTGAYSTVNEIATSEDGTYNTSNDQPNHSALDTGTYNRLETKTCTTAPHNSSNEAMTSNTGMHNTTNDVSNSYESIDFTKTSNQDKYETLKDTMLSEKKGAFGTLDEMYDPNESSSLEEKNSNTGDYFILEKQQPATGEYYILEKQQPSTVKINILENQQPTSTTGEYFILEKQ